MSKRLLTGPELMDMINKNKFNIISYWYERFNDTYILDNKYSTPIAYIISNKHGDIEEFNEVKNKKYVIYNKDKANLYPLISSFDIINNKYKNHITGLIRSSNDCDSLININNNIIKSINGDISKIDIYDDIIKKYLANNITLQAIYFESFSNLYLPKLSIINERDIVDSKIKFYYYFTVCDLDIIKSELNVSLFRLDDNNENKICVFKKSLIASKEFDPTNHYGYTSINIDFYDKDIVILNKDLHDKIFFGRDFRDKGIFDKINMKIPNRIQIKLSNKT